MVIRLRRLPMLLRVLCVLLAVLLLACTVFAPVAQAEALTATIALLGGAALVSGVLAAAGLKASDSAAWNSWCSQIASSDSVRSAAQALSKITLPAAKLVALVYAGKTYVSRALQRAIINEAITAGAYVTASGGLTLDMSGVNTSILHYPNYIYSLHPYASVSCIYSTQHKSIVTSIQSSKAPVYIFRFAQIGSSGQPTNPDRKVRFILISADEFTAQNNSNGKIYPFDSWSNYSYLGFYYYVNNFDDLYSCDASTSSVMSGSKHIESLDKYVLQDIFKLVTHGVITQPSAGVDGVIQQDGAITDPIGKDVIGSLDDLKPKVADWSNYLDTGIDVTIDGAAEGVASEAIPSLPVTIPASGQQGVQTYPDARTGTTDSTIIDTGTSTASVAQNQGVVSKLLTDVLDYLKPDTEFWDKFPLCIPYDMYLFVASLSGKDMSDSSIFDSSPGNLPSAAAADVQPQDDWQPIINIDQDWDVSGVHIPWHITLDLTPFLPLFEIIRLFVGASFIFGLYWYEWHRIKEDS